MGEINRRKLLKELKEGASFQWREQLYTVVEHRAYDTIVRRQGTKHTEYFNPHCGVIPLVASY